jgi:hypothetical protein
MKHSIKPVADIRPGDVVFLTGRKTATVDSVKRAPDLRFVLVLDNGTQLGPMTSAYSVEIVNP